MGRKRDHHFVAQSYLKRWSPDGTNIWRYRILLPDERMPPWAFKPIRGVAYRQDLYTRRDEGVDQATFENWLAEEIESPAAGPIQKLLDDESLSPDEWRRVTRFVAAQDLRTPLSYLEMTKRWERELPAMMSQVTEDVLEELESGVAGDRPEEGPRIRPRGIFEVDVERGSAPDDQAFIRTSVTIGRALWMEAMRSLLDSAAEVLTKHSWSLVEPYRGSEWFTSDHPVVRLNFYSVDRYDFGGGWGSPGSEIFMPLSPQVLLYTRIDHDSPRRLRFNRTQTDIIHRCVARRAFRYVLAHREVRRVSWYRPSVIDRDRYLDEEEQWRAWNDEQGRAEASVEWPEADSVGDDE